MHLHESRDETVAVLGTAGPLFEHILLTKINSLFFKFFFAKLVMPQDLGLFFPNKNDSDLISNFYRFLRCGAFLATRSEKLGAMPLASLKS